MFKCTRTIADGSIAEQFYIPADNIDEARNYVIVYHGWQQGWHFEEVTEASPADLVDCVDSHYE